MVHAERGLGPRLPVVVANPTDDDAFVALAGRLVADGATSPEALQTELRKSYPRTVVRERQLASEPMRMWYAYRDGHWVDSRDDRAL
jgi:hypothetical protein